MDTHQEAAPKICSVFTLLQDRALTIPTYQRPYKWTHRHIQQLFSDIRTHGDKSAYRLGTIVLHQEGDRKNIVDGQQRTISLLLTVRALIARNRTRPLEHAGLQQQLQVLEADMMDPAFSSAISQQHIRSNYEEIVRIVSRPDFTPAHIDFLLNRCEVVTVMLGNVSEAFQFFDSQNARGRDLEPHDLLKAYHLREFSPQDEPLKAQTVDHWENTETQALTTLFAEYLYRIRSWAKGQSARYFTKDDTELFKGIHIDTVASYPYVQQLRIAHHFVDDYNRQFARQIDGQRLDFPFNLDQIIINGRRFFELVAHYQTKVGQVRADCWTWLLHQGGTALDGFAPRIIDTLNTYPSRHRTGDSYVRVMFDCLLIYYLDKFGTAQLSRAIEKVFIWAYGLRLQMQVVQLASVDNYVLGSNMFTRIRHATHPAEFLHAPLPRISSIQSTKAQALKQLFTEMDYYHA